MVLRKPALPINGTSTALSSSVPYPTTPETERLPVTMPDNALTSPSQIFSHDLNHSPAFNLQTLDDAQRSPSNTLDNPWINEQRAPTSKIDLPPALSVGGPNTRDEKDERSKGLPLALQIGQMRDQTTPRSSSESERSQDSWERDDDDEDEDIQQEEQRRDKQGMQSNAAFPIPRPKPSNLKAIKRKPIPSSPPPASTEPPPSLRPSVPLGSRNPFRKNPSFDASDGFKSGQPSQPLDKGKGRLSDSQPPQISATLSSADGNLATYSSSYTPSSLDLTSPQASPNHGFRHADHPLASMSSLPKFQNDSNVPSNNGPSVTRAEQQEPLIPVLPEEESRQNPWSDIPHIQYPRSVKADTDYASTNQLQDVYGGFRDSSPHPKPGEAISVPALPVNLPFRPAKDEGIPATEPNPPSKPPRSVLQVPSISAAEWERLQKQRSETYQIKHFNWIEPNSRSLRRSSMLTQNKNGPCPLLALVNALILSSSDDSHSALGKSLANREQISIGLIIESLMDELTSDGRNRNVVLPDVDDLNRFLLTLHTGLNANPKFVMPTATINLMDARNSMLHLPTDVANDAPLGGFEETSDIKLYEAFDIPLVHGWLPDSFHPASDAFKRSAQTYEDAQTIQFGEEELEARLSSNGLSPSEQRLLQDIVLIKDFFKAYPTQLTPTGLHLIQKKISSGSFAILFRNDHFSTIYKHPESGLIFTLVTDAGYASHDEVIWESLVDISGQDNDLYSGDFRPVGNLPQNTVPSGHQRHPSATHGAIEDTVASPSATTEQQEQADADFALALQLQDEEEQRAESQRRNQSGNQNNRGNNTRGRRAGSRNHLSQPQQDIRPLIPPRNPRVNANPPVNRPAQDDDEAPPPSYDEAAKGTPYVPPESSPHFAGHQSTTSLGRINTFGSQSQGVSRPSPNLSDGTESGRRRQTTSGSYRQDEHVARLQAQLGQPFDGRQSSSPSVAGGSTYGRDERTDRDRECIVM